MYVQTSDSSVQDSSPLRTGEMAMFLLVCITFQVEKSIQLCLLYFKQLQIDSKYLDVYGPGGGGTPLYKVYRYVPPQRVWFLSRFGLKTGILLILTITV